MKEKGYNQRRACALAGIDPRVCRRKPRRPLDKDLRERLRKLSAERRRFGYPKHSTPRKALACILFTAYRVSDVRLLGRRHVREDRGRHVLTVTQTKTGQPVTVPVLDLLRDELGPDYNQIIWILNAHGAPYSAKSFSQRFSKWARDAGLPPGYSAHGLRKSVGSILAELGMSEDVIMSALGHSSPAEARTYIVDVNRSKLAAQGMDKFEAEISRFWSKKFPTFEASGKVGRKKEGKSNA